MKCWYRPFNTDEETPWQEGQIAGSQGSILLAKTPNNDVPFRYDFFITKADLDFRSQSLVVHGMVAVIEDGANRRDSDGNLIYVSRTFEVLFSKPRVKKESK
jgi:hypothetical protein